MAATDAGVGYGRIMIILMFTIVSATRHFMCVNMCMIDGDHNLTRLTMDPGALWLDTRILA
jgi:hypothetical protein